MRSRRNINIEALRPLRVALGALILAAFGTNSWGFDVRYWAWQRDDPLEEDEIAELAAQNVSTIYWQIGELEESGSSWHWKARFYFPNSSNTRIHFIPAVRLVSHEREPFSDEAVTNLLERLAPIGRKSEELQLDYDAPDRLLSDYAAALKRIRQLSSKLTITALPHWSRPDLLAILQPNVDELLPMLYDFEAEPVLRSDSPLPLIAPEKISKLIADWRACGKTWRAGLPSFARLSVYDVNQKLRGQIRNWNWDEVCFNRSLNLVRPAKFGTAILLATKPTAVANTPIKSGEKMIVREVDRNALRNAIAAAEKAGAQSVVLFRLPDSTASSGWSLRQLGHLEAQPRLNVSTQYSVGEQSLEVFNAGDGDLEPGLGSKSSGNGAYALEVQADASIFREAYPGEFAGLASYAGDKPAAIPFATRLEFHFSQLRAKQRIKTGLIQLAPGADFHQAHYRILNMEGGSSWKILD